MLTRSATAILALATLALAARLVFQPDPRDGLRQADALFTAGRYHDALAAYRRVASNAPGDATARLRLGMVLVIRGEGPAASRELGRALGLGIDPAEAALARLYQGRMAADMGYGDEAVRAWAQIPPSSPLYGPRLALEAEERLRAGDYATAEARYRAALAAGLPESWRAAAHLRLAALRASSDSVGALAELRAASAPPRGVQPVELPLIAPLIPPARPDAGQLAAALAADEATRPQILGQLYLHAGLLPLAEVQFVAAQALGDVAHRAGTYAAYTRWISGDPEGSAAQLRTLAAAAPGDPRPRAMLALIYLAARDAPAALAEIQAAQGIAPRDPEALLALGRWHAAQRDYTAAAAAYDEARRAASPAERGRYALEQARYHLEVAIEVCDAGLPAAVTAATLLPEDAGAWSALSRAQLACGDAARARQAAERALTLAPASPEAFYHLGRALGALGERRAAQQALVRAADLAPASVWRVRAEAQMAALGLAITANTP